jgi:hypothetical protein
MRRITVAGDSGRAELCDFFSGIAWPQQALTAPE